MMDGANLETKSLRLIPKTLAEVRGMYEAMPPPEKAMVSADWLARLQAATVEDVWSHGWSLILRGDSVGVGHAGFKQPPTGDGTVEIAYWVAPGYEGMGLATEAVKALLEFAAGSGQVRTVQAHTLPEAGASTRVLEKCGFHRSGDFVDPEDGLVWRWEKRLETA